MAASGDGRQRIDRWLWHARIVRTRTSAASLAESGHVRLNGQRIESPSRSIKAGDVLTITLTGAIKVLRVIDFSERRGAFTEAKNLYEDLSPPREPEAPRQQTMAREPGSGRPTKKDRRALDRLRHRSSMQPR